MPLRIATFKKLTFLTMDNKETVLETCWRDRRNLVEICDVTKWYFDRSAIIHGIPVQK